MNENLTPLSKLGETQRNTSELSNAQLENASNLGSTQIRDPKKKKENPMSTSNPKAQGEHTHSHTGAGATWHNNLTDSIRDLMGIQFRTAQVMAEKTMTLGQTWTDYLQTQLHEGIKLSQECVKYGWTVTENVKRSTFEATDRAFRSPSA